MKIKQKTLVFAAFFCSSIFSLSLFATGPVAVTNDSLRHTNNDFPTAVSASLAMIEANPADAASYNVIGYFYLDEGSMGKSREAFENYLRLAPEDANAYDSMGDYFFEAGNYERAIKFYEQAVAMGMHSSRSKTNESRTILNEQEEANEYFLK